MTRVTFILNGDLIDVASCRYRVSQYLDFLGKQNINYWIITPPRRKIVQFFLWLPWCIKVFVLGVLSDTIFVHKDIFHLSIWKFFKLLGKKIIYDFCDAIFVEDSGNKNVFTFPFYPGKTGSELVGEMIQLSDLVIVANRYLAEFAYEYSKKVQIIPMSLCLTDYRQSPCHARKPVTIGWIGSPYTAKYLSLIQDALGQIVSNYRSDVCIKLVTNGRVELPDVHFELVPWASDNELENILSFDIGIVPLPEDPFTLGKSSFKLLQFMACGLPTVCSANGFNKEVIVDAKNGFLAEGTDEWVSKLERLICEPDLRLALGKAARNTIEVKYGLESNARLFCQAISNT